jgi:hypothetical protein
VKRLSIVVLLALIIVSYSAPADAAVSGSVSFSTSSFSVNSPAAKVVVDLSDSRGVQSVAISCGSLFTATAAPDYSKILITNGSGLYKFNSTVVERVPTKLIGTVYASMGARFSFSLGFGQGAIPYSGQCQPSVQTTDAYGVLSTLKLNQTITFKGAVEIVSPGKPTAIPSNSPSPILSNSPTPATTAPSHTSKYLGGCYLTVQPGESEKEDWRVPSGLPSILGEISCSDLQEYITRVGFTANKSPGKLTNQDKTLIGWRTQSSPKFSKVVCSYGVNVKAKPLQVASAKKDADAICAYFKAKNSKLTVSSRRESIEARDSYILFATLY